MLSRILYNIFDFRSVYLGKTTTSSSRFKIGISTDVDRRWGEIDKKIKGSKEVCIFSAQCVFAGLIEKGLHQKYAKKRVKANGWGREWFTLPIMSRWYVIFIISFYSVVSWLFLSIIFLGSLYLYFHN